MNRATSDFDTARAMVDHAVGYNPNAALIPAIAKRLGAAESARKRAAAAGSFGGLHNRIGNRGDRCTGQKFASGGGRTGLQSVKLRHPGGPDALLGCFCVVPSGSPAALYRARWGCYRERIRISRLRRRN